MKCPACDTRLTEMVVDDVAVDVCQGGCGGIWFNNWELKKLDEPHEHLGEQLLDIDVAPNIKVDRSKRRQCPKCAGVTMMRHFFSVKQEVEVDECAACAGIWLDAGELKRISRQLQPLTASLSRWKVQKSQHFSCAGPFLLLFKQSACFFLDHCSHQLYNFLRCGIPASKKLVPFPIRCGTE